MKYLNKYNEGIFNSKKIDTNWLNKFEEKLSSYEHITDVRLSKTPNDSPLSTFSTDEKKLDIYSLSFKYKGVNKTYRILLRLDSDNAIKRAFTKPHLEIEQYLPNGFFSNSLSVKDYQNKVDDCVRNLVDECEKSHEYTINKEERVKKSEEFQNRFKETLPEQTLHDLILNLEDILGKATIKYNNYPYLHWKVDFPKNSILKITNSRIDGSMEGLRRYLYVNNGSDKLFEVMSELSQLNSSLESFDFKMDFSIENKLILFISQNKSS
jgi:hypothetical protein